MSSRVKDQLWSRGATGSVLFRKKRFTQTKLVVIKERWPIQRCELWLSFVHEASHFLACKELNFELETYRQAQKIMTYTSPKIYQDSRCHRWTQKLAINRSGFRSSEATFLALKLQLNRDRWVCQLVSAQWHWRKFTTKVNLQTGAAL